MNDVSDLQLQTKRLVLRPYSSGDLESLHRFLGDPETMSYYPEPYSRERVQGVIERNQKTWRESHFGLLVVIQRENNEIVGDCGITLQNIDGTREFEVGYRFSKDYWGRGYALEAAKAVVEYGFRTLGSRRLCSYMPTEHHASRRVAEKVGMTFEKSFRNSNNRGVLTSVYSISAS